MKAFCFTVDDNIRFLRELTLRPELGLFDHPYPAMYRRLHERYGLKVQLNLFYEMPGFDLSMVTDRCRGEFEDNADWLKLSFHSRLENVRPYESSAYEEVFADCTAVHRQILRFAGPASLAETTTVHYCRTTPDGLRAMKDCGMKGLLGLFGTPQEPRTSYSAPPAQAEQARRGEVTEFGGVKLAGIDLVINIAPHDALEPALAALVHRDQIRVMIHEQYFYPDYADYQENFEQKLDTCFRFLTEHGYGSRFFQQMLAEQTV